MSRRGAYAKGLAKRNEILSTALDLIARNGYRRTTVRELAEAVGLSQAGLLHHFGTKEELFTEILRRRDEEQQRSFDPGTESTPDLADIYPRVVRQNAGVPGLVQLYNRFAAEAGEPSHPAHEYFRQRFETVQQQTAEAIRRLQDDGRLPADLDAARIAVILAALSDGLQTYWIYHPDVDMADHIAYFWSLLDAPRDRPDGLR